MTGPFALLVVVAAVLAVVDWWAVATSRRTVERLAKPAVIVALLAAVVVAEPSGWGWVRVLVLAALAASLVGDVLLIPPTRSLPGGLVAFGLAQLAYGAAFALGDPAPLAVGAGIAIAAVVGVSVGRPIVRGAPRPLRPAVVGYLVVILGMASLATGTLVPAAVVGAWAFVASDATLGWSLFVAPAAADRAPVRVAIMASYHAAQVLLVLALVG